MAVPADVWLINRGDMGDVVALVSEMTGNVGKIISVFAIARGQVNIFLFVGKVLPFLPLHGLPSSFTTF